MKNVLLLSLCGSVLTLAGCQRPVQDVPGHLEPGNVHQVTQQAQGNGTDQLEELSLVPLDGFVPPSVPLVEPPKVASIWFIPRHSMDGRSEREGHWVHTQLGQPRFYRDRAQQDLAVPLSDLSNVQIGRDGRPYIVTNRLLDGQIPRRDPVQNTGSALPWVPSGEENVQTTVIVDQSQNGGPSRVVGSNTGPASNILNPDGTPNAQSIDQMVQDVNRRIRDAQANEEAADQ